MTITAVGFDLDETLAVPTRDRAAILSDATARVEAPSLSREAYLEAHARNLTGETRTPIFADLLADHDTDTDPKTVANAYRQEIADALVPIPDAEPFLARLRREYRVGLLTNGPRVAQHDKLELLGWTDAFDSALVTGDLEAGKPDPAAFAALLDAPAACVASGSVLPGTPPSEAYDYLLESLDELTDYAENVGVDLGIEFEPELLVECTEEVLTLIDDVESDALGVNLDVGHAAVCGEDPAESIRQCAGHITGIHLEDIEGGRGGKHYHLIPGEGDLDFEPVFGALDDIGYDGFATFELYTYPDEPDEAARRARDELVEYVR